MRKLLLSVAIACLLIDGAKAAQPALANAGDWWRLDTTINACRNDMTPQAIIEMFKDHAIDDDALTYVKGDHGEMMYAKIRATDNGDNLEYVTLFHSYHKNGKLVTGKQSCEGIERDASGQFFHGDVVVSKWINDYM
jgi:hypothetical protein